MQKQRNFRILYLIYRETFVKIKESINIFQTHLKIVQNLLTFNALKTKGGQKRILVGFWQLYGNSWARLRSVYWEKHKSGDQFNLCGCPIQLSIRMWQLGRMSFLLFAQPRKELVTFDGLSGPVSHFWPNSNTRGLFGLFYAPKNRFIFIPLERFWCQFSSADNDFPSICVTGSVESISFEYFVRWQGNPNR